MYSIFTVEYQPEAFEKHAEKFRLDHLRLFFHWLTNILPLRCDPGAHARYHAHFGVPPRNALWEEKIHLLNEKKYRFRTVNHFLENSFLRLIVFLPRYQRTQT